MRRAARRLLWSAFVVWAVVSIVFVVDAWLPGDPARFAAGPQARPADVARIREELGLNRPPLVRYARLWRRLLHVGPRTAGEGAAADRAHATCVDVLPLGAIAVHVDLGRSFQYRQPVARLVAARAPRSLALAAAGLALQLGAGLAVGVLCATRRGSWIDRAFGFVTPLGLSVPMFFSGLLFQYLFAYEWRLLPFDGFGVTLADHLRGLVLPALTLGIYGAAYYARLVRDELRAILPEDWVRTARAKGASGRRVLARHALRNALVPVATAVGLDLGVLFGGSIVTETVFRWPGLGDLSVKAAVNRDGPVIVGCVVVTSIAVVASNLAVDLLCARLDPRLR